MAAAAVPFVLPSAPHSIGVPMSFQAEYIWVDGSRPTKTLRSKTKIVEDGTTELPDWG